MFLKIYFTRTVPNMDTAWKNGHVLMFCVVCMVWLWYDLLLWLARLRRHWHVLEFRGVWHENMSLFDGYWGLLLSVTPRDRRLCHWFPVITGARLYDLSGTAICAQQLLILSSWTRLSLFLTGTAQRSPATATTEQSTYY